MHRSRRRARRRAAACGVTDAPLSQQCSPRYRTSLLGDWHLAKAMAEDGSIGVSDYCGLLQRNARFRFLFSAYLVRRTPRSHFRRPKIPSVVE